MKRVHISLRHAILADNYVHFLMSSTRQNHILVVLSYESISVRSHTPLSNRGNKFSVIPAQKFGGYSLNFLGLKFIYLNNNQKFSSRLTENRFRVQSVNALNENDPYL
jgi:hypothetical protein